MSIEKVEQLINLMKMNDIPYMKYKEEQFQVELDLNSHNSEVVQQPKETTKQNTNEESEPKSINAEIIGTFYLQDEETLSNPLVNIGDKVNKGQVVGYIESMKVLNEITSDEDGVIEEIHIDHGEPVEYGQTIFTLK